MSTSTIQILDTPDGPFTVLADESGAVLSSGWTAQREAILQRLRAGERPVALRVLEARTRTAAADAVDAFYAGEIEAIDEVRVRQHGTPLQLRGWSALRAIVPGRPLTYAEFASALGVPTAVRAAAAICARNAPALFVPCHRVLRTGGALGGFAWGVDVKRSLLAHEA